MNEKVSLQPDLEQRFRRELTGIPVFETMGFEFPELADGWCRVRVPRQDSHKGIYDTFHGGLLTTVADCAAWVAIVTRLGPDTHLITTDMHIRFLAPCWTAVIAEARVMKFGRTLCPVEVQLFNTSDEQVAVAQVTYFRLDNQPRAT
ncbi:MAG: hypothetical protein HJJLKODD_02749 [Phycisphaerae bacterium]|nr:hypothetical protein [Phycisphaerae bacterium]